MLFNKLNLKFPLGKSQGAGESYETPAYENAGGTGDRVASIAWASDITWGIDFATYGGYLVDGLNADNLYLNNAQAVAGKYIRFDFTTQRVINEFRIRFSAGAISTGVWRWQGSDNGTDWTNIGDTFEITSAGGLTTFTTLSANTTAYRYYQLLGVSGNSSWDQYWQEVEFKIGNQV